LPALPPSSAINGAAPGDKTILDAFLRIERDLEARNGEDHLLDTAVDAAAAALEEFRGRESRLGRARIMVDHFGRPDLRRGLAQPGFATLLEFGRSGNAVVKLSGPFHCSSQGLPYFDVDPFIAAAIDAFTLENCVWGSDWPFVRVNERVDYGPGLACLTRWLPDRNDRHQILWENPARLFGFR